MFSPVAAYAHSNTRRTTSSGTCTQIIHDEFDMQDAINVVGGRASCVTHPTFATINAIHSNSNLGIYGVMHRVRCLGYKLIDTKTSLSNPI